MCICQGRRVRMPESELEGAGGARVLQEKSVACQTESQCNGVHCC